MNRHRIRNLVRKFKAEDVCPVCTGRIRHGAITVIVAGKRAHRDCVEYSRRNRVD
jgi:hypothetical protein